MKTGKALVLAAVLFAALVLVASESASRSAGIQRGGSDLPPEGCTCHGAGGEGAKDGKPDATLRPLLLTDGNPLPMVYEPGKKYNLTVTAQGGVAPSADEGANLGGFNLKVTAGTLEAAQNQTALVKQVTATEFTHTAQGDVEANRNFHLVWTAPTTGPAVFTLWFNAVNGDGSNNAEDTWNGVTIVVLDRYDTQLGAGAGINPEEIGVNFLAHWVGLISFLAVFIVLLAYYFVLKYGESIHTTDHRDRKEK